MPYRLESSKFSNTADWETVAYFKKKDDARLYLGELPLSTLSSHNYRLVVTTKHGDTAIIKVPTKRGH